MIASLSYGSLTTSELHDRVNEMGRSACSNPGRQTVRAEKRCCRHGHSQLARTSPPPLFKRVSGDRAFSRALQISSQSGVSGSSSDKNIGGCTSSCSPFSKGAIRLSFLYRELKKKQPQTLIIVLLPAQRIMFPGYLIPLWNVFI